MYVVGIGGKCISGGDRKETREEGMGGARVGGSDKSGAGLPASGIPLGVLAGSLSALRQYSVESGALLVVEALSCTLTPAG